MKHKFNRKWGRSTELGSRGYSKSELNKDTLHMETQIHSHPSHHHPKQQSQGLFSEGPVCLTEKRSTDSVRSLMKQLVPCHIIQQRSHHSTTSLSLLLQMYGTHMKVLPHS
jgi:hypothetical protein